MARLPTWHGCLPPVARANDRASTPLEGRKKRRIFRRFLFHNGKILLRWHHFDYFLFDLKVTSVQTYYVLIATAVLVLGLVLYSTLQRVAQTSSSYRSSDLASLRLDTIGLPEASEPEPKRPNWKMWRSKVDAEYADPDWNKRLSAVVSLQAAEENASLLLERPSFNNWSEETVHSDPGVRVPFEPVLSAPVFTYAPAITPAAVSEPVLTDSPSAVEETPAAMESIDSMDSTERSTYAPDSTYSAMANPTVTPEEASDLFTRLTPEDLEVEDFVAPPARKYVERRENFSNPNTARIVEAVLIGFAVVALATSQRILSRERSPRGSRQQVA